ncbi:hypothetical protein OSB04_un001354 [Centaurea solstitialis]|uniref:Reverse transcriptase RNase H-like domain-containing protein n=1 Tax=Centaurea solstitialis TaxID=347529 RepID=A0AA38S469_9ASTR|nr:hypothetical protein OSB04_un001354 [Centaurea solstitialis]
MPLIDASLFPCVRDIPSSKFIETESCLNWINIQPIPCSFISLLLLVGHCDRKECPVYYLSRVITGPGTRYSVVEGHCLTLVFVTQKLRHYFMSCAVHIVTRWRAARRFLILAGYDMKCVTPNAIKSKALVDLLAHFPSGEYEYAPPSEQNSQLQYWRKPTNLRKLASNVNSTHVQQNVP